MKKINKKGFVMKFRPLLFVGALIGVNMLIPPAMAEEEAIIRLEDLEKDPEAGNAYMDYAFCLMEQEEPAINKTYTKLEPVKKLCEEGKREEAQKLASSLFKELDNEPEFVAAQECKNVLTPFMDRLTKVTGATENQIATVFSAESAVNREGAENICDADLNPPDSYWKSSDDEHSHEESMEQEAGK